MTIEPRDYLSIGAVVVSLSSLFVAIRIARFNRRVKGVELRAQVLVKIAEAKNEAVNLQEFLSDLRREAEKCHDLALSKTIDYAPRIDRLILKLDEHYDRVNAMPSERGVEVYEKGFHDVHDIHQQFVDLMASAKRKVEAHKNTKGRKGANSK